MDREQDIHFVYQDGVLKPEEPVDLPDGARGVAHIRQTSPDPSARADNRRALEAIKRIASSGAFNSGGLRLTREQMHERR